MTKEKASTTSKNGGRWAEVLATEEPRIVPEPRIELESGNYAVLNEDIVHVYLPSGQELFGVSVHVIPFDAKMLGSVMQIYLLAYNKGRTSESAKIQGKLTTMIKLVFE